MGEAAFQGCTALVSVKIPTRLTTVGRIAFSGCTKLATVTFEEDCALQTISEGMFHKCTALSSITIPKKISAIDNGAFVASGLQTVTFAADGAKVQLYAEASGYSTSTVPAVARAKYGVFGNCTKLETVEFNNRLSGTAFAYLLFVRLEALDKVTINDVGQYVQRL
ncbi:MAG: leucine-rich repeat domain-containing protein [Christensenellaceae bacterium]